MNPASEERQLGDYRLREILGKNSISITWLAEQVSISRLVIVDELRADLASEMPAFLADVRAKAAVDHPIVGSVYEASAEPGMCFYAHELLPGVTLEQRKKVNEPFLPARLSNLLRKISEAQLQYESLGYSSAPMDLDSIHIDSHGVVRLKNLAVAGPRTPDQSVRDIKHLGAVLVPLVADGQPGATRMFTLFGWMRGEGLEAPLDWGQTRDVCMQIEHQLADPLSIVTPVQGGIRKKKKQPLALIGIGTGIVLVAIVALAFKMRPPVTTGPLRSPLPEPVAIAAGSHPTPDGIEETLPAFRISANEITIGQYADFLSTLAVLAKENRAKIFDHAGQPTDKASHEPDDWTVLFAAAKTDGSWNSRPVSLDTPVVGVDWWDAAAYAEWKKGRLPTQEEWFASLSKEVKTPASITPGEWQSVTALTTDRTPAGLIGMAGSVSEWTAKPSPNPANPLGEKFWVIIGGSYRKPGSNALTREWTADRSLRRPDLGFRIVLDPE